MSVAAIDRIVISIDAGRNIGQVQRQLPTNTVAFRIEGKSRMSPCQKCVMVMGPTNERAVSPSGYHWRTGNKNVIARWKAIESVGSVISSLRLRDAIHRARLDQHDGNPCRRLVLFQFGRVLLYEKSE